MDYTYVRYNIVLHAIEYVQATIKQAIGETLQGARARERKMKSIKWRVNDNLFVIYLNSNLSRSSKEQWRKSSLLNLFETD